MSTTTVTGGQVKVAEGFLSDHYDTRHRVLRLSPDVYEGRTLAALGIAAHEAGLPSRTRPSIHS